MTATLIHSVELVTDRRRTRDAWVLFEDGTVRETGSGGSWHRIAGSLADSTGSAAGTAVVDGAGRILTPGFIDLHVHGGGGHSHENGAAAIRASLAAHRAHGTTRAVLSFVSDRPAALLPRLAEVAELVGTDPMVLGSHLEGPFLSDQYRGAHDPALLTHPAEAAVEALLGAARGTLRQVTLAPELPGAAAAIPRLVAAGTAVAVGHTGADYETARDAFTAGASILTHTFNAMPPLHHRAPGPIGAALADPGVTLELINDGVHVHPVLAGLLFTQAPERIALITDAMAAACSHDGDYALGSLAVTVRDGVARLSGDGAIAGSTLTLDAALRQSVAVCGVDLADAVLALTATPAAAIGRGGDLGSLRPGYAADAVLLDRDLAVQRVWVAGDEAA
ncbi:N-acetylglucosamine-6-phosphate deacetylase [Leucobacter triazinivorans]|uniref:N-acetylglucosamine-6-phosphate deacetylase n=1 Tax=Leucobacter triazinivorans TaxID=1784719 RepID=A0A4P6KGN9_9MICO|nr:N-acetylglucosamine-6-phosphate deacetylase [Leucobacter triazinivorans]QBE48664.1 N-acetylglucosamine-6-phosphate deacetylase [Leucobacter triazinivorans]